MVFCLEVEMEESRLKRYLDKIDLINNRIRLIHTWIDDIELEDFIEDEKTKLAVYKAFQEIVEAYMDVFAMMCKDMNIPPKDDYTNLGNVGKVLKIDVNPLIEANGLRNVVIYRYNSVDDKIAYSRIKDLLPHMEKLTGVVKGWLRR